MSFTVSNAVRPIDFRRRSVGNLLVEREFDILFNRDRLYINGGIRTQCELQSRALKEF